MFIALENIPNNEWNSKQVEDVKISSILVDLRVQMILMNTPIKGTPYLLGLVAFIVRMSTWLSQT